MAYFDGLNCSLIRYTSLLKTKFYSIEQRRSRKTCLSQLKLERSHIKAERFTKKTVMNVTVICKID